MQLLPVNDKQCKLNAQGEVSIKVRMIGSTAEKITSESITKGIESMHLVLARCANLQHTVSAATEVSAQVGGSSRHDDDHRRGPCCAARRPAPAQRGASRYIFGGGTQSTKHD